MAQLFNLRAALWKKCSARFRPENLTNKKKNCEFFARRGFRIENPTQHCGRNVGEGERAQATVEEMKNGFRHSSSNSENNFQKRNQPAQSSKRIYKCYGLISPLIQHLLIYQRMYLFYFTCNLFTVTSVSKIVSPFLNTFTTHNYYIINIFRTFRT